ncbi:hypothetical protein BST61_g8099 [Cercospora zeina]
MPSVIMWDPASITFGNTQQFSVRSPGFGDGTRVCVSSSVIANDTRARDEREKGSDCGDATKASHVLRRTSNNFVLPLEWPDVLANHQNVSDVHSNGTAVTLRQAYSLTSRLEISSDPVPSICIQ